MEATAPLKLPAFLVLIRRYRELMEGDIRAGHIIYWDQAPHRPLNGSKTPRLFTAFDAALVLWSEQLVALGPRRANVSAVLRGFQMKFGQAVDRPDGEMAIALFAEAGHVVVAAGGPEDVEPLRRNPAVVGFWSLPTAPAVAELRERAAKASIELPKKLGMPAGSRPRWAQDRDDLTAPATGGITMRWGPFGQPPEFAGRPIAGTA